MSQYESKSEQEKYRKLGYHESFDINKDLKLQQGFDDGYDETMEYAFKIGTLLGQGVFETELNEIIKNDDGDDEDEIPLIVRQYLENQSCPYQLFPIIQVLKHYKRNPAVPLIILLCVRYNFLILSLS